MDDRLRKRFVLLRKYRLRFKFYSLLWEFTREIYRKFNVKFRLLFKYKSRLRSRFSFKDSYLRKEKIVLKLFRNRFRSRFVDSDEDRGRKTKFLKRYSIKYLKLKSRLRSGLNDLIEVKYFKKMLFLRYRRKLLLLKYSK